MDRVFVYGTLKRGFCRHAALAAQEYLGAAKTVARYQLFDLGEYPGLVRSNNGASIEGELYSVTADCLKALDTIEGVESGLYSRESIQLLAPWDDAAALTYIYLQSVAGCRSITQWTLPDSQPFSKERDLT